MKKAIIIFSVGLSLIIGGAIITVTELSAWNKNEKTFEDEGYEVRVNSINVNIEKYSKSSITNHITYAPQTRFSSYTELADKYQVDNNQPVGILKYEVVYYPRFGECELKTAEYAVENQRIYFDNNNTHRPHRRLNSSLFAEKGKVYLDLSSTCYLKNYDYRSFRERFMNYSEFKTIMRLRKFPFNIQQVIITINPNDEYKLIK